MDLQVAVMRFMSLGVYHSLLTVILHMVQFLKFMLRFCWSRSVSIRIAAVENIGAN